MERPRVLITGAARGIGAETARVLATRGARVSLVGLEAPPCPAELDLLEREVAESGTGLAGRSGEVERSAG